MLFVVDIRLLLVRSGLLSLDRCILFVVVRCLSVVVCCVLFVCCMLCVVWCLLCVGGSCWLCVVRCALRVVCCLFAGRRRLPFVVCGLLCLDC